MTNNSLLHIITIYLAVINVATFCTYGIDKMKAKKSMWRIREGSLLMLAILGGSIGALLGMKIWHSCHHHYPTCANWLFATKTNNRMMKLKKRKIKYATIFFICWFGLLFFLIDGVLKFQILVDYFGSYALVEISLLLLVILPTLAVYIFTKEK